MEKLKILTTLFISACLIVFGTTYKSNEINYEVATENTPSYYENYDFASNSARDKKILESVVQIKSYLSLFGNTALVGSATAFSVKYDKKENTTYLLTNHHVCADAMMTGAIYLSYVKTSDSIPDFTVHEDRVLEIIAADEVHDLCLVKATNEKIPSVKFRSSSTLDTLEDIYSIGGPQGIFPIWIYGKYSGAVDKNALGKVSATRDFMLLSTSVVGGQSGSPVYDSEGKVVGIIFATLGIYGGVATPSDSITDFLKPLL